MKMKITKLCAGFVVAAATIGATRTILATDATNDAIAKLEGWYTSSKYCTENGVRFPAGKPCASVSDPNITTLEGWIAIKRVNRSHALFDLEALQFGTGGDCLVHGIAELKGSRLVYVQRGENNDDDGTGISIGQEDSKLTVRYLKQPEEGRPAPFCHGASNLTQIVFKVADRRPVEDCKCGIESP